MNTQNPQLESRENDYFTGYSELINPWHIANMKKLGITNLGVYSEGATITDSSGNTYIDCTDGYGIFNVGHNNPSVVKGIIDQLGKNEPFSKPFINTIQVELARLIKKISPGDLECVSFLNSGSEAVESAIKLVRLYKGKKKIISIEDSFYGHTLGALSLSGVEKFKKNYEPLLLGIEHLEFNNIDQIASLNLDEIGAIILEPVQHDAGVKIAKKEYLKKVREICDKNDIILIFDEVITGLGKTGYMFASEYYDVVPDILIIGKSFGGGLTPFGAMIAKKKLWQRFGLSFPMSASSYGGNSLACRAAIESIKFVIENNILSEVRLKHKILNNGLKNLTKKYPEIFLSADGIGLLFGLKVENNNIANDIVKEMIKNKILLYQSFSNPNVLMIEPPLVINEKQIRIITEALENVGSQIATKNKEYLMKAE